MAAFQLRDNGTASQSKSRISGRTDVQSNKRFAGATRRTDATARFLLLPGLGRRRSHPNRLMINSPTE